VTPAEQLADLLVSYDRGLAERVAELLVAALGGPPASARDEPGRLYTWLAQHGASSPPESVTTAEWKLDFAHRERLRQLGLCVTELLEARR
jgi:hypothetical protein